MGAEPKLPSSRADDPEGFWFKGSSVSYVGHKEACLRFQKAMICIGFDRSWAGLLRQCFLKYL